MNGRHLLIVRRLNVAVALIAGLALVALIFGAPRLAVAGLVVVVLLQTWNIEVLRDLIARNRGIIP